MTETKIEGVYLIKNDKEEVTHVIFRHEQTGHKLVYKTEEISLDELATLILE